MLAMAISDDIKQRPDRRHAPAEGCFGVTREALADGGAARQRTEQIFADWGGSAYRFYMLGYRDGRHKG